MKRIIWAAWAAGMVCGFAALAQNVGVDWSALSSGAGTSTAGKYTLAGVVGQPAVARLNSRDYTLDSGYLGIVAAIQQPGAPELSVRLTTTNSVVVSWPMTWPGWVLTEAPELPAAAWTNVLTAPIEVTVADDVVVKQVVVTPPVGSRFYKLRKPEDTD